MSFATWIGMLAAEATAEDLVAGPRAAASGALEATGVRRLDEAEDDEVVAHDVKVV